MGGVVGCGGAVGWGKVGVGERMRVGMTCVKVGKGEATIWVGKT